MGGGVSLSLANSILCFSKCFSYSFESKAFFGWQDIFLPTFVLLYICSRIPILVVLEFSRETGCSVPRQDLCGFCRLHPTMRISSHKPFSSSHSKRQSSCWYLSYTQVSKYKRTSGICFCMDSRNMDKQCFPIVSERYVVRTFVPRIPSNPFLQRKPCFRTFPRFLSFAPLAHPCTLCSAPKCRQSCGTCKTSIVGSASPQLVLLLRNIASPFSGGKTHVFGISDF